MITQILNKLFKNNSHEINAEKASRISNRGTTEEKFDSFISDLFKCILCEAKSGNNYITTKIPEEFQSQDCEAQFKENGYFTHVTTFKTTKILTIIW